MEIYQLSYAETRALMVKLQDALEYDHRARTTLRVSVDGGGVKFKINEGMWTAPMGQRERCPHGCGPRCPHDHT